MRKTTPVRGIRDDEMYSLTVFDWAATKYPTVDVEATFEVFADHCKTHGSMYADFDAGLRTWIRNGVDRDYGGIVFKRGKEADPKWVSLLADARQYGFREPYKSEPPGAYRTDFEMWKSKQKTSNNVSPLIADALKKFG